jgi:hypothetical protein
MHFYVRLVGTICSSRHFMIASVLSSTGNITLGIVTGIHTAKVPTIKRQFAIYLHFFWQQNKTS